VRVLIVGAERLGRTLAGELVHSGHDVRLLEPSADRIRSLPRELVERAVHGSPLRQATLTESLAGCDAIATVTTDDSLNAVVALAAKRELGVPLAVAVISNPGRAEALAGMGAHIVCPTTWTARELHMTLARSGVEGELLLGHDFGVYRAEVPARLSGRTLSEIEQPGELIAVAVERNGQILMAMPGLELSYGDVLHVAATARDYVSDLVRP
jgi:trk system potassium uptake protein TrkA